MCVCLCADDDDVVVATAFSCAVIVGFFRFRLFFSHLPLHRACVCVCSDFRHN